MRWRFGEAGKLRVRREFSIERMAEQTLWIYAGILASEKAVEIRPGLRLPEHRV
jgi:hypothetical protein